MAIGEPGGRQILIVEDESLILMTVQDIVEALGHQVAGTAMRAEAAIAILAERPVDAALLDVNLGAGHTSYPVADALAARGIPFAFLTGYGAASLRDGYRDRMVLSKPVDERVLAGALHALLSPVPAREG